MAQLSAYRDPTDNDINKVFARFYNDHDNDFQYCGKLTSYEDSINGGFDFVDDGGVSWENCKVRVMVDVPSGFIPLKVKFIHKRLSNLYYVKFDKNGSYKWVKSCIDHNASEEIRNLVHTVPPWMTYIQKMS